LQCYPIVGEYCKDFRSSSHAGSHDGSRKGGRMGNEVEYIVVCWHCGAPFDAMEAGFCNHNDPTKICPFCLNCFCDAPQKYKLDFIKGCPAPLLAERIVLKQGGELKLGELLIKAGKITREQLDRAFEGQQIHKKRLGEMLILMGLITEGDLRMFLVDQKAVDTIDLENFEIDFSLIEELGKEFCLNYRLIPIECLQTDKEKILRFASASKDDLNRIKLAKELKQYVLIPYLADKQKVKSLLEEIEDEDLLVLK